MILSQRSTKIDIVQIKFHNFVLAVDLLQLYGNKYLFNLALPLDFMAGKAERADFPVYLSAQGDGNFGA